MEVSSNSNNYQMMQQYQQKIDTRPDPISTQPVKDKEPAISNESLYEGSNGNLIRNEEGSVTLTPQGENNRANNQEAHAAEEQAQNQAQQDAKRETGVDYIERQSKKSQVEIYLAVATDNKVEFGDDKTPSIIESLRDVQKQNNAVAAYATYQENQQSLGV